MHSISTYLLWVDCISTLSAFYIYYLLTGGRVHVGDPLAVGEDCVSGDWAGLLLPAARRHVQLRVVQRLNCYLRLF